MLPLPYISVRPADLVCILMGLVAGMDEGVLDFFTSLAGGSALFNDPADFGEGMAKGAQSLFKGTAMLVTAGI